MSDGTLNDHDRLKDSIVILAGIVIILTWARYAATILEPFLLSLFIAVMLGMPVRSLKQRGVVHWLSVVIVVGVVSLFFSVISVVVGNTVDEFYKELPTYQSQFQTLLDNITLKLSSKGFNVSQSGLIAAMDPGKVVNFFDGFLSSIGAVLSNILLILLTVVFILADSTSFSKKMRAHPNSRTRLNSLTNLVSSLGQYMEIKALVSLLTGVLVWAGLSLLDVKFAVLWGLLAFLLNFIPTIGSILAAVPVILLSILDFNPTVFGMTLLLYFTVNIVVGNFIEPLWMAEKLGLSTLAVFLSLLFWGWVFGAVGMFLCVPLTMAAKSMALGNTHTRWLAILVSNVPESEDDETDTTDKKRGGI